MVVYIFRSLLEQRLLTVVALVADTDEQFLQCTFAQLVSPLRLISSKCSEQSRTFIILIVRLRINVNIKVDFNRKNPERQFDLSSGFDCMYGAGEGT